MNLPHYLYFPFDYALDESDCFLYWLRAQLSANPGLTLAPSEGVDERLFDASCLVLQWRFRSKARIDLVDVFSLHGRLVS